MTCVPACRARLRFVGPAVAVVLLVTLGACQQAPPPPPPAVAAPPPPVPAEPQRPPARRAVSLAWSFDVGPDHCIATAAGDLATLTVTARRTAAVALDLAVSGPQAARITRRLPVTLRFSGPSGSWSLPASGTAQHRIGASSALDELSLGRVVILLGGGTLDVAVPPPGLPTLQIPPAGPQGQSWSDCASRQMI